MKARAVIEAESPKKYIMSFRKTRWRRLPAPNPLLYPPSDSVKFAKGSGRNQTIVKIIRNVSDDNMPFTEACVLRGYSWWQIGTWWGHKDYALILELCDAALAQKPNEGD
jgi:hypothetical protein